MITHSALIGSYLNKNAKRVLGIENILLKSEILLNLYSF